MENYTDEKWLPIKEHPAVEVSNMGRVRRNGIISKPFMNGGYYAIGFAKNKKSQIRKVHRLVLLTFVGEPKEGQIACHKNDIQTDNRLENLYWGTRKDNAADCIRLGNFKYTSPGIGESHHSVKYPDSFIEKLHKEFTGIRGQMTELAKKYNVSISYISAILNGKVRAKRAGVR